MHRVCAETSVIPGVFRHETRNVPIRAERGKRMRPGDADDLPTRLRTLPLITDHAQDDEDTLALARRHGLSAYDAAYLETAKRRGAKLATLDSKLEAAARNEGLLFQPHL